MIVDGQTVSVGDKIKFRTINSYDTNVWTGDVMGFVNYDIAKLHTDVVAYHTNVLKTNPDVDPAAELDYILIKTTEGVVRAYAVDWVQPTTLVIVDTSNNITVKVYNVTAEQGVTILTLLKDNNYSCEII